MQLQKTLSTKCEDKPDLKNMTLEEIEGFISSLGKEKFRAKQIMKWLYHFGSTSLDGMTNLSKEFRAELGARARISSLSIETIQKSADGTQKVLFRLSDGNCIESVLIRERNHWTICISTQVGCAMQCAFCYTGRFGLKRNLLPAEIVDQITLLRFCLPEGKDIKNIVMMGMGEPLANYDAVIRAIAIITSDYGLSFSHRRITVSTCGLVPVIHRLGKDVCVNLAVSLNAADDEKRNILMPVNRSFPLQSLLEACRAYRMPNRRRITFEYILIKGINDSPEDAEKLAILLRGIRCKLNLIAFNEFPESNFKSPAQERINTFRNILIKHQYTATLRPSKGGDILAACGQLSGRQQDKTAQR